jgi:hypothetical protein
MLTAPLAIPHAFIVPSCPVFILVGSRPPLMGRLAATAGLIHTKAGPASGRWPEEQGWLHQGLGAGGQGVAEL